MKFWIIILTACLFIKICESKCKNNTKSELQPDLSLSNDPNLLIIYMQSIEFQFDDLPSDDFQNDDFQNSNVLSDDFPYNIFQNDDLPSDDFQYNDFQNSDLLNDDFQYDGFPYDVFRNDDLQYGDLKDIHFQKNNLQDTVDEASSDSTSVSADDSYENSKSKGQKPPLRSDSPQQSDDQQLPFEYDDSPKNAGEIQKTEREEFAKDTDKKHIRDRHQGRTGWRQMDKIVVLQVPSNYEDSPEFLDSEAQISTDKFGQNEEDFKGRHLDRNRSLQKDILQSDVLQETSKFENSPEILDAKPQILTDKFGKDKEDIRDGHQGRKRLRQKDKRVVLHVPSNYEDLPEILDSEAQISSDKFGQYKEDFKDKHQDGNRSLQRDILQSDVLQEPSKFEDSPEILDAEPQILTAKFGEGKEDIRDRHQGRKGLRQKDKRVILQVPSNYEDAPEILDSEVQISTDKFGQDEEDFKDRHKDRNMSLQKDILQSDVQQEHSKFGDSPEILDAEPKISTDRFGEDKKDIRDRHQGRKGLRQKDKMVVLQVPSNYENSPKFLDSEAQISTNKFGQDEEDIRNSHEERKWSPQKDVLQSDALQVPSNNKNSSEILVAEPQISTDKFDEDKEDIRDRHQERKSLWQKDILQSDVLQEPSKFEDKAEIPDATPQISTDKFGDDKEDIKDRHQEREWSTKKDVLQSDALQVPSNDEDSPEILDTEPQISTDKFSEDEEDFRDRHQERNGSWEKDDQSDVLQVPLSYEISPEILDATQISEDKFGEDEEDFGDKQQERNWTQQMNTLQADALQVLKDYEDSPENLDRITQISNDKFSEEDKDFEDRHEERKWSRKKDILQSDVLQEPSNNVETPKILDTTPQISTDKSAEEKENLRDEHQEKMWPPHNDVLQSDTLQVPSNYEEPPKTSDVAPIKSTNKFGEDKDEFRDRHQEGNWPRQNEILQSDILQVPSNYEEQPKVLDVAPIISTDKFGEDKEDFRDRHQGGKWSQQSDIRQANMLHAPSNYVNSPKIPDVVPHISTNEFGEDKEVLPNFSGQENDILTSQSAINPISPQKIYTKQVLRGVADRIKNSRNQLPK